MKRIITCAGYDTTGSSVVADLLKEFKDIKSFGASEFRFLQDPNGVGDLEEKLRYNNARLNSDRAIYDFRKFIKNIGTDRDIRFWKKNIYEEVFHGKFIEITENYINELSDLTWQGIWHDVYRRKEFIIYKYLFYFMLVLMKLKLKKSLTLKTTKIYFSYPITDFSAKTKKYLNDLFEATDIKENILFFDQLIPICNQEKYFKYFENIKVVNFDRDPRDLYVINKIYLKEMVVPTYDVDIFIKHFLLIRKHKQYEHINNDKILNVKFEDFIYKYYESLDNLLEFLEIPKENHIHKKRFFNPEISINNTQIYKLHPELNQDILKIERELGQYCYDFPFELVRAKDKEKEIF